MAISFEVLEKDIAGRLGRLRVGGKTVHTPALFPVVNPHLPLIPPAGIRAMGAEAIITNAYIFAKSERFREAVLEKGLHKILGFDGVIMTDSGAFQQSVYGDVEITNRETLSFQRSIGSEILVPLDIATPPQADRTTAESDLSITMARIRESVEIAGMDNLAAPVQGGRFPDLREQAGKAVSGMGFSFCPVGGVVPFMEAYRYRELVEVVLAAKRGLSPAACVHLFGAGHPSMFALAVAMGCDVFDSAAYALFARDGRYLTTSGSFHLDEITEPACPCDICRGRSADDSGGSRQGGTPCPGQPCHHPPRDGPDQGGHPGRDPLGTRGRAVPGPPEAPRWLPRLPRVCGVSRDDGPGLKAPVLLPWKRVCLRTEVYRHHTLIRRIPVGSRVLVTFTGRVPPGYDTVFFFKPPFGPYPPDSL